MNKLTCMLVLFSCAWTINSQAPRFKVIREWKYVNFTWPNDDAYKKAEATGAYIPDNNIISGMKYYEGYYYITLPRMKNGVPATLTRIPAGDTKDTAPALQPFPSWEMNSMQNCYTLHNVQNIEIDQKGQMWIIDGGRVNTISANPSTNCQPKLVRYDLKKQISTLTYEFPDEVANRGGSFLYDLVVDDSEGGYVYITDNGSHDPGIIVYSIAEQTSWKIRHSQTMKADPMATYFVVNGISIATPIHIAGIALGPRVRSNNGATTVSEDREVYYAPLSSLHLYSISSSVLKNNQYGQGEYQGEVKDIGLKPSQSAGMLMDNRGVLYYGFLANNTIMRWDSRTSFVTGQAPIAQDATYVEWPNSFTFDNMGNLAVITNRLDKFIYGRLSLSENNFRILEGQVGGASYLYDDNNYNYITPNRTPTQRPGEMKPIPSPLPPSRDNRTHLTTVDSGSMNMNHTGSSAAALSYSVFVCLMSSIFFATLRF